MDNTQASQAQENVADKTLITSLISKRESYLKQSESIEHQLCNLNNEYKAKLETLNAKKKSIDDALSHIVALIKLENPDFDKNSVESQKNTNIIPSERLIDMAFKYMETIKKPIHYKELTAKLLQNKVFIPGKDTAATLLSRICRDPRFKRTQKRGIYALSVWRLRKTRKSSGRKKHK